MSWSKTRDPFAEQNIQNTNILLDPWGKGTPASSKEYNINFLLRSQAEQELYRSLMPSGFVTRITPVATSETSTALDTDGELVTLLTNAIPVANTIRIGRCDVVVNGWKLRISNIDGTNSIHSNITLSSAPSTGGRVDLVFLECWLAEFGGTSASISNTSNKPTATTIYKYGNTQYRGTNVTDDISEVDAEINRRWQIQYRVRTVESVDLDTYPSGVDHSTAVKSWGTNPSNTWSGSTSGVGSAYSFVRNPDDQGLFIAGDGSSTAKSILGTVDGFSYALPIAAVFRRNSGVWDVGVNPMGSAAIGPVGGTIASGISGRPDGLYYDQVAEGDILNIRHRVAPALDYETLDSTAFDRLIRGNMVSYFGSGDNVGNPLAVRGTRLMYAQALNSGSLPITNVFSQYNSQRRIFSDATIIQQTQFTFTGGAAPDNSKPTNVNAPAQPTGTTSTASGTLTGGTSPTGDYFVKTTYTNTFGETTASVASAVLHIASAGTVTVNSPAVDPNATGWNVYFSTTVGGTYNKQNTVPVALGTGFSQSSALNGGSATPPANNTASSTLIISASSAGLTTGTTTVVGVDGNALGGAGLLNNSLNVIVYNTTTLATIATGTWSGSGTAIATFTLTPGVQWGGSDITNGVVVVIGLKFPSGNGIKYRAEALVGQNTVIGGITTTQAQIGVSGTAAAADGWLNTPKGVWIDGSGNIFIADTANHRVIKYNASFVKQGQFGVTGTSGSDTSHLNNPVSVALDSAGNVYVSDTSNHRIVKLSSALAFVTSVGVVGVSGSDNAHFDTPQQIAFDSSDNIYIADSNNKRVQKFNSTLVYQSTPVTGLTNTNMGCAVDSTGTVVYTTDLHAVKKFVSGVLSLTFGTLATAGSTPWTCNTAQHIRLDSASNVYFADSGNQRIVCLNSNFIYIGQFGVTLKSSTDKGHFSSPFDVAFDASGLLYMIDSGNHRLLKIHKQMGAIDFPIRQLEVLSPGALANTLNFFYNYRPYQGVIGAQGSTLMNYSFRAVTDLKAMITTCGTAGRNSNTEDNLNGFVTRLPLPKGAFGTTPVTAELEFKFDGSNINYTNFDSSGLISAAMATWGGQMATYGTTDPSGTQAGSRLSGSLIKISQNTLAAGYPNRGVNTIQQMVDNLTINNGFDSLGLSFGNLSSSLEHLTMGWFLAIASGGFSTLPLVKGELVLIVVTFRTSGNTTAIYGNTTVATAVDVFRIPSRNLVRF